MFGIYKAPFSNPNLTNYGEEKTTFWDDFTQAEIGFGEKGVRELFSNCWKYWKNDKVYTTELVLVLNWKIWEWHDKKNEKLEKLYYDLWAKLDSYVMNNWKGEDLAYFLRETD